MSREDDKAPKLSAQELVRQYKSSGQFDRLRKRMMEQIEAEERERPNIGERLDNIIDECVRSQRQPVWSRTETHGDIMREIERHTLYERLLRHAKEDILAKERVSIEEHLESYLESDM